MGVTPFFEKISFGAIFLVLMLMPIVSHAGGLGMAPLVFILGVLGLILAVKTKQFNVTRFQIAIGAFLTWLCITAIWSPYKPDDFLTNYLKLFLMVFVFYWNYSLFKYAGQQRSKKLQHLLLSMMFFTVGILIIDLLNDFGLTIFFNPADDFNELIFRIIDAEMNLGHSITILVLLSIPAISLIEVQFPKQIAKLMMFLFVILLAWAAMLNGLTVGILGLIGVVTVAVIGYFYPRHMPHILLATSIAFILFAPMLAYWAAHYISLGPNDLPQSWDHRLRMWGYCWDVIAQHPLSGRGFDASRSFSETFIAKDGRELAIVSLHPHNAGIQIWAETGLIGAVLASITLATLFKPVHDFVQNRAQGASVSGVIIAVLIISSLTYGAWQFWWWSCVFFAVGVLHLLPKNSDVLVLDDSQSMP